MLFSWHNCFRQNISIFASSIYKLYTLFSPRISHFVGWLHGRISTICEVEVGRLDRHGAGQGVVRKEQSLSHEKSKKKVVSRGIEQPEVAWLSEPKHGEVDGCCVTLSTLSLLIIHISLWSAFWTQKVGRNHLRFILQGLKKVKNFGNKIKYWCW